MTPLTEFRKQLQQQNTNRRKYLEKQFRNNPLNNEPQLADEVLGIEVVSQILNHEPILDKRQQVAIRISQSESWYRDALKNWSDRHPEAGIKKDSDAGLYRFALEFFVKTIVLNPKNTTLDFNIINERLATLNDPDPILADINFQLETKITDLKNMTGFIAAMMYLENTTEFGPARKLSQEKFQQLHSELDSTSDFAKSFQKFQENRQADKAGLRKRQPTEGVAFDYD